jgi:hypothetical protein
MSYLLTYLGVDFVCEFCLSNCRNFAKGETGLFAGTTAFVVTKNFEILIKSVTTKNSSRKKKLPSVVVLTACPSSFVSELLFVIVSTRIIHKIREK